MDIKIGGQNLSFNGKKQSLLVSTLVQKYNTKEKFEKSLNGELETMIGLVDKMEPEQIVLVRWHSGYELGYPNDYYGVGAISCNSIKPWNYHQVDHVIQNRNPFSKIKTSNPKLLGKIEIDYENKKILVSEGYDDMNGYYLPELEESFKRLGFSVENFYLNLKSEESEFWDLDYEIDLPDD